MRNPTILVLAISTSCALAAPIHDSASGMFTTNPNIQKRVITVLDSVVHGASKVASKIAGAFKGSNAQELVEHGPWPPVPLTPAEHAAEIARLATPRSELEVKAAIDQLKKMVPKKGVDAKNVLDRAKLLQGVNWNQERVRVLKNNAGKDSVAQLTALADSAFPEAEAARNVLGDRPQSGQLTTPINIADARALEEGNINVAKLPLSDQTIPWGRLDRPGGASNSAPLSHRLYAMDEDANLKARIAHFAQDADLPGPVRPGPNKELKPLLTPPQGMKAKAKGPILDSKMTADQFSSKDGHGNLQIATAHAQKWQADADGVYKKVGPEAGTPALPDANGNKGHPIVLDDAAKKETHTLLKLGGATVAVLAGGWLIVEALGQTKGPNGQVVTGSGQTPEEGAFSQSDEQTILDSIKAHPDTYPELMKQIRSIQGLSQKEDDLFTNADPARVASQPTVPGANPINRRRSLMDLD
ncbi:hypothetical protein FRB97_005432 [Tulasnella sp. 331]|nr:hypothetical protein FRB97_005432 [Tulasnella sp. 331]